MWHETIVELCVYLHEIQPIKSHCSAEQQAIQRVMNNFNLSTKMASLPVSTKISMVFHERNLLHNYFKWRTNKSIREYKMWVRTKFLVADGHSWHLWQLNELTFILVGKMHSIFQFGSIISYPRYPLCPEMQNRINDFQEFKYQNTQRHIATSAYSKSWTIFFELPFYDIL